MSDYADDAAKTPVVPSGWMLEQAISAWQQYRANILTDPELVEDEAVIAFALAQSSVDDDPRDLLRRVIDGYVWATRRVDEAKEIAQQFAARRQRYEKRADFLRTLIDQLMSAIPLRQFAARLAVVSVARAPASVLPLDEGLIPDEYFRTKRELDREHLRDDLKNGVVVPGAVLSSGGTTLRIRRLGDHGAISIIGETTDDGSSALSETGGVQRD